VPRQARERSETGIYHLIIRGINKQNIFEDEEDRQIFIEKLGYYKMISGYIVYGYCLMDNHIHLLLGEGKEMIGKVIQRISSSYVRWYNQKYERCGHLFQERFKSEVVKDEAYFLTVLRYIHRNPIKAGIIQTVDAYPWSSYPQYGGTTGIVDIDVALGIFSNNRERAQKLLYEYSMEETVDECIEYQEKVVVSDEEILKYLRKMGIVSISKLQQFSKEQRNDVLRSLKNRDGISIRQLARITGISKSVINRI
jgi:putative transposase